MARDPSYGKTLPADPFAGPSKADRALDQKSACKSSFQCLRTRADLCIASPSATCDDDSVQSFIYNEGSTSVQVSGTNLCVEFGPGLGRNGTPLRLQNCRSNGAPGQRLFINTADGHISLENGPGQCADVRDAEGPLQSWRCISDNTNQVSRADWLPFGNRASLSDTVSNQRFSFEQPQPPPPPPPPPVAPGQLRLTSNPSLNLCIQAATDVLVLYVSAEATGMQYSADPIAASAACVEGGAALQAFTFIPFTGVGPVTLYIGGATYFVNISPQEGTAVIVSGVDSSFAFITKNEDGTFRFQNRDSNTCMEANNVEAGSFLESRLCDPGSPLQVSIL